VAVSPLGGVIYTNQASPFVTQIHQQALQHPEVAQFMLNKDFVEKDQEVEKVTESAKEHGIDPDKDNNDNSGMFDKKSKGENKEDENEEEQEPQIIEPFHLDIKA
jgi:hypothetical protein